MSSVCRNCPVCELEPQVDDRLSTFPANHHNVEQLARKSYDLTYCPCGELVYLSPLPSYDDILAMYAETDQFATDGEPNLIYRGERSVMILEYIASCLTSMMRSMEVGVSDSFRVLEVGAGLAWMCRAAKMMNWGNQTVAQDLTHETVEECRWVDHYVVEDLMIQSSVDEYGPYDVISLTHVLEHIVDPVAMLGRLKSLLSPRGFLFITAPGRPLDWQKGSDSKLWESWSYHHVPAHIQYFSEQSFEKAACAVGLEVAFWKDHEDGQAFEGWLRHPVASG